MLRAALLLLLMDENKKYKVRVASSALDFLIMPKLKRLRGLSYLCVVSDTVGIQVCRNGFQKPRFLGFYKKT